LSSPAEEEKQHKPDDHNHQCDPSPPLVPCRIAGEHIAPGIIAATRHTSSVMASLSVYNRSMRAYHTESDLHRPHQMQHRTLGSEASDQRSNRKTRGEATHYAFEFCRFATPIVTHPISNRQYLTPRVKLNQRRMRCSRYPLEERRKGEMA
jgi:hypothetical protein